MKAGYINFKLKAAIVEQGLTHADVAQAAGLTPATFSKKINGIGFFDEIEMQLIAEFLKKPVSDIFFCSDVTNRITNCCQCANS
jgi:DNA-binding XRE family transcriptional regulator